MKYITCLVIGLFMTNTAYAYTDIKVYHYTDRYGDC
jgi:hypothetical protein